MTRFDHFNFNVLDLERSLDFYRRALDLTPVRQKEAEDGSFRLVYLGDAAGSPFQLELTWLRDRTAPYDLGECEFHLALRTDRFEVSFRRRRPARFSVRLLYIQISHSLPARRRKER